MNCAEPIPKNTVIVCTLRQHRPIAGKDTILIDKFFGIRADKTSNAVDVAAGKIGTAIAFAARTAFSAFKQSVRMKGIRWHDAFPKLFST